MRTYKTYKYYLFIEFDDANQTIIVAADIENYTSGINNTDCTKSFFNIGAVLPINLFCRIQRRVVCLQLFH